MTLEDFLKLTRRHLGTILVCLLIGGVGAFGLLKVTPTQYTASSTAYVRVTVPSDDGTDASANAYYNASQLATQKVKAFVPVFTSQTVAQAVIDQLKLNTTPSELAGRLTASNATNALTINVTASADSADQARQIADTVVDKAAVQVKELEGEDSPVSVVLMTPADLSQIAVSPSPTKYLGAGILAGILVGYVIAFARTALDRRLRTAEDIQSRFETPVLGVIPDSDTVARTELDDSTDFRAAESLRKLRTNLRYADVDRELRRILITSPEQGDGKSSVSSNLAKVMALSGQEVLLIDADLRRPTVRSTFGVSSRVGLTQVLVGSAALEQAISSTSVEGLSVLPAGEIPPNPSELLGSQRMSELLTYLSRDRVVIVDAAPVLPVTDAEVLAKHVDGTVLVVGAGKTTADQLEHAAQGIIQTGGKVLGVVLNKVTSSKLARLKYGDAQYGYGAGYGDRYGYRQESRKASKADSHRSPREQTPPQRDSGRPETTHVQDTSVRGQGVATTPAPGASGPSGVAPLQPGQSPMGQPQPHDRVDVTRSRTHASSVSAPTSDPSRESPVPPVTPRRVGGASPRTNDAQQAGATDPAASWETVAQARGTHGTTQPPATGTRSGVKFPPLRRHN